MPTRTIRFFVSNDFVSLGGQTEVEIRQNLVGYIPEINAVFAKNTTLQLSCDINADISFVPESEITTHQNYDGPEPLPADYLFHCWINYANGGANYLGRIDVGVFLIQSDELVIPPDGTEALVETILHELAHAYRAGLGEYYNANYLVDCTGTFPNASERIFSSPGTYWQSRQDVLHDPLSQGPAPHEFCELTAWLINRDDPLGNYNVPDGHPVVVEVIDAGGNLIQGATVKQRKRRDRCPPPDYTCICSAPWSPEELTNSQYSANPAVDAEGTTGVDGRVAFNWTGPGSPHSQDLNNGSNVALLFEVSKAGFVPNKAWITAFDVQAGLWLPGGGSVGSFRYDDRLTIQFPYRSDPVNNNPNAFGWTWVEDSTAYGGDYLRCSSSGAAETYMAINLPADAANRTYEILATWVAPHPDNTSAVTFRVDDTNGYPLSRVTVDQTVAPAYYQDETGRWWGVVGRLTNPAGSYITVWVENMPLSQADAVRLLEVV